MSPANTVTPVPVRRADAQYTPANKRTDNCKGCKHMDYQVRDPDTAYERQAMRCKLGDFPIAHGGICDAWERAK